MKNTGIAALCLALAACGSSDATEEADAGGMAIDIGGATITTDADGNATLKGEDGLEVKTGPGDVELPLGLSLPPGTSVSDSADANLPGMGRQVQVSGETSTAFDATLAHFRAQAETAGMTIDQDGAGTGNYVISASNHGGEGGFTVEITPMAEGASFNLVVSTGKTLGGLVTGG